MLGLFGIQYIQINQINLTGKTSPQCVFFALYGCEKITWFCSCLNTWKMGNSLKNLMHNFLYIYVQGAPDFSFSKMLRSRNIARQF